MAVIDYSTPEGKLRMRLGDTSDIPFLPSSVYNDVYAESGNNLVSSAKSLGSMILGQLAFKTHRKMGLQLEVWGKEAFDSYKEFLILTVTNPAFMDLSPLPYSSALCDSPFLLFKESWERNFTQGTEDQQLNINALYSPNEGGPYGSFPMYSSEGY